MLKRLIFSLIFLLVSSVKGQVNLQVFNLPASMEQDVQEIIKAKKIEQEKFLDFVKNKVSEGKSSLILEFPFYHINTKLKNSNWTSLPKSQIYFLALKEARRQVSQILFNLVLGKNKTQNLQKRLQSIIDKQAKYYIFSEKVFKFHVNSKFSFISTAKVRLKISFLNFKKILDKEGLLYSVKDKFNVLPMFNLLNTKTGYVQNWWQINTTPLFSSAISAGAIGALLQKKKSLSIPAEIKTTSLNKGASLDKLIANIKTQFLSHFAEKAKPLSLYFFRPTKFNFQKFLPRSLLKKSAFYPIKIASYLAPDLILNGDVAYSLDEKKRILKISLLLKVFKMSSKKTVVIFSQEKSWNLESGNSTTYVSQKIRNQILQFFKESGSVVLSELVGMKNKALLQAYEVILVAKGSLLPVDLYQFMSVFKFHVREVLDIQLQTLSRSEFHLKLVSTLESEDIVEKMTNLVLPNYKMKAVSLFSDKSKISFFLKKIKNKK